MEYAPGHIAQADIKRLLLREMSRAVQLLLRKKPVSDESIHSARKMLKRARTGLRLFLRGAVSESRYSRANAELRDAGRVLAHLRDSKVMLQTTSRLLVHEGKPSCRRLLLELQRKAREHRTNINRQDKVSESGLLIDTVTRRVQRWRISNAGPEQLRKGATRIYGKARKALRAVYTNCSDETLHELRKQTKHCEYALKRFESDDPSEIKALVRHAEGIADCLGDDHDLVLVQRHIRAMPPAARKDCRGLNLTIARERKKLQKRALEQSHHLYGKSRKEFRRLLAVKWDRNGGSSSI